MRTYRCLTTRFTIPALMLALLCVARFLPAQQNSPPPPPRPVPRPADIESADAIIAATYDVISGPAGQARDWDRFRSLFVADARLIPTGRRADGTRSLRTLSVEDYVRLAGPGLERDGFFEREIGRRLERYGQIVHLMSAYESRRAPSDEAPFARGVNSFQLWYDGSRWWVVTIYWEGETPETPIPPEFLRKP